MTQKIIKIGNSYGVIIPKDILEANELHDGVAVQWYNSEGGLTLKSAGAKQNKQVNSIDPSFVKWLHNFVAENEETLKELAKR